MTLAYAAVLTEEACMVCSWVDDWSEVFAAGTALTMAGARSNPSKAPDRRYFACRATGEPDDAIAAARNHALRSRSGHRHDHPRPSRQAQRLQRADAAGARGAVRRDRRRRRGAGRHRHRRRASVLRRRRSVLGRQHLRPQRPSRRSASRGAAGRRALSRRRRHDDLAHVREPQADHRRHQRRCGRDRRDDAAAHGHPHGLHGGALRLRVRAPRHHARRPPRRGTCRGSSACRQRSNGA